jgi:mannosyltransferase OCH1-like enzyme
VTSNKDPLNIAEDDNLRSACIRKLVQKPVSFKKRSITNVIPKIIVQFWHDLNHIPLDVQLCIDSWKSLVSQDFNWVIFDDHTARNFINKRFGTKYVTAFDLCHHPAMRCDFFRLCYMLEVGGFYVDADEVIKELIANLS